MAVRNVGRSARLRLFEARWILAVVFALAVAGVYFNHLSLVFALAGFLAVFFTVLLAPQSHSILQRAATRSSVSQDLWPDTGMKMVVDALPDPCFLVDRRGITRYANPAARDRFGRVRPGDPLSFRLRPPALLEALDRVISGGGVERIEWNEKVPTDVWMEAHIAPIQAASSERDRSVKAAAGFILVSVRDLTEQRRLERMRADFVANASHELRTPLASLTGFVETLQGPAKDDIKARERFLAIMLEQAGRMRRLIDDLLSLSRIELRAHVQPETVVDLARIIGHTTDALKPLAKDLEVEIHVDLPDGGLWVRGDADELTEVFENLVENSLKYGAPGKRIDIAATLEESARDDGWWVISVRDYGPGIEAEHLPRLTERFYRVDVATSREMKGTGLGLAIVKHILTRHRARLDIQSVAGEGACFTVRIRRSTKGITINS